MNMGWFRRRRSRWPKQARPTKTQMLNGPQCATTTKKPKITSEQAPDKTDEPRTTNKNQENQETSRTHISGYFWFYLFFLVFICFYWFVWDLGFSEDEHGVVLASLTRRRYSHEACGGSRWRQRRSLFRFEI